MGNAECGDMQLEARAVCPEDGYMHWFGMVDWWAGEGVDGLVPGGPASTIYIQFTLPTSREPRVDRELFSVAFNVHVDWDGTSCR